MIVNKDPSRRDLVMFGATLPVFFALVGLIVAARTGSTTAPRIIWGTGAAITVVYFSVPRWRRSVFVGWSYLVYPIGWVITHVLLLLIFALLVSPIGLLVRLLGNDPLARRLDRSAASYWTRRDKTPGVGRYFQQF